MKSGLLQCAVKFPDVVVSIRRRKNVTQLVFEGERFDVMSVRRWRDRVLASG